MADAMLVGGVNLDSAEDVFRTVARVAGDSVRRIPDGACGRRRDLISAQLPLLFVNPAFEQTVIERPAYGSGTVSASVFRPKAGLDLAGLRLALPYARDAVVTYSIFADLQEKGEIPPDAIYQVTLPTAIASTSLLDPAAHRDLLPRIEASLGEQVRAIVTTVPPERLAIQWDVEIEFLAMEMERMGGQHGTFGKVDILTALARLSALVPKEVELGYHLCYGNVGGRHFLEPDDAGLLVEVANHVAATAERSLNWVHLPVPADRADDAYFAPLGDLRLALETKLYLGLVHAEDGAEGAAKRIAAASAYVRGFGVATECGLQHVPAETVTSILQIQRDLVVPIA